MKGMLAQAYRNTVLWLLAGGLCLLLGAAPASAATYVNRIYADAEHYTIQDRTLGSTTWTLEGSPYLVEANITVAAGATLSVAAGVTVQVAGTRGIYVLGNIVAASATFTAIGGRWLGIYLSPASSASVLNACTINWAGQDNYGSGMGTYHGAGKKCAVYVDACSPTITNCTIANGERHGLELYQCLGKIQNNVFTDLGNNCYAIVYDTPNTLPNISGNSGSGTGVMGVLLAGGTITRTGRWARAGANFPYYLYGRHTVAAGTALTINPGVTLRFSGSTSAGLNVLGTLSAVGSLSAPITFTSAEASPGPGNWLGIYLGPQAGASVLTRCILAYAGADNYGNGLGTYHSAGRKCALYIDSCSPGVTYCTIESPERNGIELYDSAATVQNNTFRSVRGDMFALVYDTPNTFPVVSGNVSTPGPGRVSLSGGTIGSSGRWMKPGQDWAYFLDGNSQTINAGVSLTVDPGVAVKLSGSTSCGVYVHGTLTAEGTAALPIVFTSSNASPGPGNWLGLYLGAGAGASSFAYCTIACAGADNYGNGLGTYYSAGRKTMLFVDSCSPTFNNVTFTTGERNGVELYASNAAFTNCAFNACGWSGLRCTNSCRPTLAGCTFTGNGGAGAFAVSMDATCAPVPTSVLFSGNARQGIEVRGGTMAADTLWKNWNANAPYAATGGVSVAAGVRFTIEPGTTVKWNGSTGTALRVHGVLIADGAAAPITFTGLHDDSVGGDTNGDGASAPGRGEWLGVYLSPASGASVLNQCAIRYAGADNYGNGMGVYNSAGRKCLVYVDRCSPTITRCAFAESERHGLELYGSEAAIQENTFTNMGSGHYAIVYDTPNTLPVISGNSASGTGIAGICLSGGSITRTGRWMKPGASFPYYLYTNHSFAGGTTFTIDPGTTIRFSGSTSAALYVQGTLSAAGTAAEPITFTSAQDSPGPGNWLGIYLGPQAGASVLSYCTLAYAGADNYGNGMGVYNSAGRKCALYVDACSPRVTDCTIESPERHGIELYNSAATLRNNTFRNVRSDMFALVFDTPNTFPVVSGTVFAGSPGRIHLAGGTISKSGRWMKAGGNFAYYLGAAQHINAGVTLTVDPGVTVRLSGSGSTGIYVAGTLKAVGGALAPITFTSSAASPGRGNWLGIYLGPTAGRSALCYCTIACAGADNYGNGLGSYHSAGRRCTLFVDGCTPTLSNLTISDSERNGLEIYGGSPTLYSSLFLSCGWSGIVAEAGAAPLIANNTVSGCGGGISCSGASPRIVNNIVAFNGSGITRSGGEPTLGSNCVYGNPSGDYAGIAAGAGDFSMDPLFVDRAAGDYHTPGQSPGINAGNNSAVQSTWRDHDGRARVYGGRVDLGAYELPRLPAPAKPDLLIRNAGDTGWVGGNAFGTSQSRAQMASAAMKAIYEVKVENDGEAAGPFVLKAVESAGTGWAITYKAGDTDISDQMRGGGYPVPLMAGASAVVTVDVQPGAMVTPGAVKTFLFRVYKDAADTTSRDLVSAKTTAAPAKKLAFLMQPSNVGAGTAIAPAVQVAVQDQFGGTVPVAKTVTLAIATNPAGGRLTGTLSASTVHGVATFSNLKIDRAGSGYTLRATASGLAAATSAAFDVSAGAKAKMVFTVQPASTLAGSVMSPAVVVSIVDAAGNLVADATDTVILTIARNPARGTLSGSTAVAAVGGVAAFAGLSIDKAGVGYMLRASAADLTGVYSATFDITSGPVAARRGDRGVLVAACAGEQAVGYLAPSRLDSPESGGRSAGLRFVPLQAPAGRSPGSAWEFAIEASWPSADVTITWPDLSGMGSGDRVVLQDLDATVRRSMRSTASYTFRAGQGVQRRFRVLAEPRGAGGVAITGLEVAPLRSNTRVVRFTLSTDASVDLEILSPSGRTVATVARGRAFMQGVNQAVWSGPAAPGLYLLRAAATAEDGGVVQAVRPVAVVR